MNQIPLSRRIGIYGGSFDPVHLGHIHLAIELKEFHSLDEVWFCPTFSSPFKSTTQQEEASHRLQMLILATEEIPGFSVINHEIKREGISYTIDTIRELQTHYPESNFFLLLGTDTLPYLHLWKEIDQLVELVPLLIGHRSALSFPYYGPTKLQQAIQKGMTPTAVVEISATKIRSRLKNREYCGHLLPAKVLDYIYKNQLYFLI